MNNLRNKIIVVRQTNDAFCYCITSLNITNRTFKMIKLPIGKWTYYWHWMADYYRILRILYTILCLTAIQRWRSWDGTWAHIDVNWNVVYLFRLLFATTADNFLFRWVTRRYWHILHIQIHKRTHQFQPVTMPIHSLIN